MKKISRLLIALFLLFTISSIYAQEPLQKHALAKTVEAERISINTVNKNLYLGVKGKDSYVFRVNKASMKGAKSYKWQIIKEKGNPKAITIDAKTGKVTAKSIGTAYIRCKITMSDRTLYSEEAKIMIYNNITKVAIDNVPADKTIYIDEEYDFNEVILDTKAGKATKASGITRWEIKDDNTEAVLSEEGAVKPAKEGKFRIRAVCFQNQHDYELWLNNKKKNSDLITANSDWVTISTISAEGIATTQEQLDALLAADHIRQITFDSEKELKISIAEGDYSNKHLIVLAPSTDVTNHGVFKTIMINKAKETKWEEYALSNTLMINDSIISVVVAEKASVSSLQYGSTVGKTPYFEEYIKNRKYDVFSTVNRFTTDKNISFNYTDLFIMGTIDNLVVAAASSVDIKGSGKLNNIDIQEDADGTRLATSIVTNIESKADYTIALWEGAEAITSVQIPLGINVRLENYTTANIVAKFGTANYRFLSFSGAIQVNEKGSSDHLPTTYTSNVLKLSPSEAPVVTAGTMVKGDMLSTAQLTGRFKFKTQSIDGLLYWVKPDTIVNSSGYYMWTFTPYDTDHYNVVIGYSPVTVIE